MKKILFLLLLPFAVQGQVNYDSLYNALHINYFSSPYGFVKIILPLDTAKVSWQTNNIKGSTAYINNKIYINNGSTWQPTASYFAGFGLGLTGGNVFYVDTSKIVTHFSLVDSLGSYSTKVALSDTAESIRTQTATFATHTALVDTAAAIRASSSSTAGLATTVALTDTAAVLRAYAQTNLNDTAIAIRSAIPSIAGLATTVALTDTAIARAATAQTNLVDTAIAIRGSFPSTAGLATTVALTDTAIARAATAQTNLVDTASALRATINTKLSSVSVASGTGINVVGSSPSYTVNATGGLTAGSGISVGGSFPTYTVTNASPNQTVNIAAGTGATVTGSYPSYTVAATGSGGTVTSVGAVAGNGISIGGTSPITGSGTYTISGTGSLTAGTGMSVSGSFPTYTVTNTSPSSGGTVTSLQVVSNAQAYSVTPNTATTSSGIYSIIPTGTSSQFVKGDGSKDGTTYLSSAVTSVGIVAGSNISISGSSPITSYGTLTVTSTPPGSSTQMAYNNGGLWAASTNVQIGSADNNMFIATNIYTTAVTAPASGNVKPYGSSINGQDELWTSNSSGVDLPLQTGNGMHQSGRWTTNGTATYAEGFFTSAVSTFGTSTFNLRTYDAANLAPNLMYNKLSGLASPNISVELLYGFTGRDALINNSAYGGGSRLIIDCVLPSYTSTQRFFAGYTATFGQISTTSDPSSVLNIIGVGKDAADATLFFMFNNGSGTATKVNTGITPTANDEYIITVTLPSNTTSSTVAIERRTKTASTKNSATNIAKIPAAGTLMYWHVQSNSGVSSTAPVLGIIQVYEELRGY